MKLSLGRTNFIWFHLIPNGTIPNTGQIGCLMEKTELSTIKTEEM
tara:strand:+ start:951 stop:1085 length:135 start_codon:yes stop_codon:yes gene_type:complete